MVRGQEDGDKAMRSAYAYFVGGPADLSKLVVEKLVPIIKIPEKSPLDTTILNSVSHGTDLILQMKVHEYRLQHKHGDIGIYIHLELMK